MLTSISDNLEQYINYMKRHNAEPGAVVVSLINPRMPTVYQVWGTAPVKRDGHLVATKLLVRFFNYEEAMVWIDVNMQLDKDKIEQKVVNLMPIPL